LIEDFVDIRGARLHCRRAGRGETLVFLHGVQGLPGWTEALERLSQRFAVIAPDHPGFGRSACPDAIEDVGDLAFFYLDALAVLSDRPVHLVGHSLGGWIAMEMAIRSTARIMTLTLVGAAGIRVDGVARGDMFIGPAGELRRLLFASEEAAAGWEALWQASPDLQEIYDRNRHAAAKYTWQPRLYNPKLANWLHRIDVPTQLVWGESDHLIPAQHAAALAARIPGAETVMIPGAGHYLDIESPELCVQAISRFIERQRP